MAIQDHSDVDVGPLGYLGRSKLEAYLLVWEIRPYVEDSVYEDHVEDVLVCAGSVLEVDATGGF
jgi:hypothetical protein